MTIGLGHYLAVAAILFTLGILGIFLNRKNIIVILMSIELILLSVNINLVAFSTFLGDIVGQVFALLVLAQGAVIYRRGEFAMDGFRAVLEVNLMSLMACATKFHPLLREGRGALIIVSSTAAYHSTMGNPAYNASKTGAVGLTRTLGEAWAEDGIRVNGIAPGLVDTKMTKVTTDNPKRLEGALSQIPLRRLGTPEDMAGAALFLASPLASYVIGQTIVVDGGLIL